MEIHLKIIIDSTLFRKIKALKTSFFITGNITLISAYTVYFAYLFIYLIFFFFFFFIIIIFFFFALFLFLSTKNNYNQFTFEQHSGNLLKPNKQMYCYVGIEMIFCVCDMVVFKHGLVY